MVTCNIGTKVGTKKKCLFYGRGQANKVTMLCEHGVGLQLSNKLKYALSDSGSSPLHFYIKLIINQKKHTKK